MTVVNPQSFTVTDTVVAAQGVTQFDLVVGTTSGGPYTASKATVLVSSLTAGANGTYVGVFSALSFSPALSPFTTYFMVAEAQNSSGTSGGSPEASFQIETAPTAPTGLALA